MTPLLGFTPDAPTTSEGIIVDCSQFIPYESGMRAAPSITAQGSSAQPTVVVGAATHTYLDGSRRVFVGTGGAGGKLYDLSGTTFTDRSRAGGYTMGATTYWSFAQFGDSAYAANIDVILQKSTTGSFSNVTGAPQAKIIESIVTSGGGQVFAFNTIDSGFSTSPDRWWCSALNDGDSWTVNPSVSLANSGRLLGAEGPITAAKKFGADRIIAYKDRALYIGTFVGAPAVWQFTEIPDIGCIGMNAVANLGTLHAFIGQDNLYIFDGARPYSIANGQVRQWFLDNSSVQYRAFSQMVYDRDANLLWIFFPNASSTTGVPDRALVYHVGTKQWGRADRSIEFAFIYNTPTETFDSASGTYDSETDPFDATNPGTRVMALFDTSHTLQLLTGTPTSSYFTSHDMGDDSQVSRLDEVSLRYMTTPTSASVSAYYSMATGGVPSVGPSQSASDVPASGGNKFKLRQTARWHRLQFNFSGATRVVGYEATKIIPMGTR